MSSSINLAVLVAFTGTLVLGKGIISNEISIAGEETNKIQVILDLYYAKIQSELDTDIFSTLAKGYNILDDTYRYEFLVSTSGLKIVVSPGYEDYSEHDRRYDYIPRITRINSLKIVGGIFYYNEDKSSNQFYSVRTDGDNGQASVIEENAVPSFFDSITISYPEEKLLTFGNIEINTEVPFVKYRVAHHLLEKLFFIGFNSTEATTGTLFSADLSKANLSSVQADKILQDINVAEFVDVAVDQYTGDILLATENEIFALHKMLYFSKVNQFGSSPDETNLVDT